MGIIRIGDKDYHEESYHTGYKGGLKGINACPDDCNFIAYDVGNRRGKELRVQFRDILAELLGNRSQNLGAADREKLETDIRYWQETLNLPGNAALTSDESTSNQRGYVFDEDYENYGDHLR